MKILQQIVVLFLPQSESVGLCSMCLSLNASWAQLKPHWSSEKKALQRLLVEPNDDNIVSKGWGNSLKFKNWIDYKPLNAPRIKDIEQFGKQVLKHGNKKQSTQRCNCTKLGMLEICVVVFIS